jgi:hypothetical protein
MKCGGHCENVCLQIDQYNMKYHMFYIDMGGCEIVLGVKWLRNLGAILMDFKELTMQFNQEIQQYKFQGITTGSPKIISSHCMEKILKKGHSDIISKVHSIQATETPSVQPDLQSILSKHQVVFSTPQGLPPSHGVHDHSIPSSLTSFLLMFTPIIIPFPRKMKLRKLFKNCSMSVLYVLVLAPILLLWS